MLSMLITTCRTVTHVVTTILSDELCPRDTQLRIEHTPVACDPDINPLSNVHPCDKELTVSRNTTKSRRAGHILTYASGRWDSESYSKLLRCAPSHRAFLFRRTYVNVHPCDKELTLSRNTTKLRRARHELRLRYVRFVIVLEAT